MKPLVGLISALAIVSTGCMHMTMHGFGSGKAGSGKVVTEDRKATGFTRIRLEGAGEVTVTAGKDYSVKLTVDDNLTKLVKTTVDGDTLVIKNTESINPTKFQVAITLPKIEGYTVDGAGDVTIKDIDSDTFEAKVDGAGNVKLFGKTKSVTLTIDGAGNIEAYELASDKAKASIDGAGAIEVNAVESLDASVDGAGSIEYKGTPKNLTKKVDGIGSIDKKS